MINQAIQNLKNAIHGSDLSEEDPWRAAETLRTTATTADDRNVALRALVEDLNVEYTPLAGFVALTCGGLVEDGGDPEIVAEPLTDRLRAVLKDALSLCEFADSLLPPVDEWDDDFDYDEAFAQMLEELDNEMPDEHDAWVAFDLFWRPAIAVYIRHTDARIAARELSEPARRLADYHEGGDWLSLVTSIFNEEPILVLEPSTMTGLLGHLSGVVENFQLNTLLMATFPPRSRVPEDVAAVARGEGPQQIEGTVTGVWDLYTWEAAEADGTLSDDRDEHWIENAGLPTNIPVFEGYRVILLGPPREERSWRCQRIFEKVPARVDVDRVLDRDEVGQWLRRMGQEPKS